MQEWGGEAAEAGKVQGGICVALMRPDASREVLRMGLYSSGEQGSTRALVPSATPAPAMLTRPWFAESEVEVLKANSPWP